MKFRCRSVSSDTTPLHFDATSFVLSDIPACSDMHFRGVAQWYMTDFHITFPVEIDRPTSVGTIHHAILLWKLLSPSSILPKKRVPATKFVFLMTIWIYVVPERQPCVSNQLMQEQHLVQNELGYPTVCANNLGVRSSRTCVRQRPVHDPMQELQEPGRLTLRSCRAGSIGGHGQCL